MDDGETLEGKINIDLVKSWIYDCDANHRCGYSNEKPPQRHGMQLVDMDTKKVVKAPLHAKYLILSYVWGQIDRSPAYRLVIMADGSKSLPSSTPQTIKDAIQLTRLLHERYLWIDVYCIDQMDASQKIAQINEMDAIFQEAWLTIVALSASSSISGIVGVSFPSTVRQIFASSSRSGLLATLTANPSDIRNASAWNTRSWTLQEELISKRMLMLADDMYWLQCWERSYSSREQESSASKDDSSPMGRAAWSRLLALEVACINESEVWTTRSMRIELMTFTTTRMW